MNYLIAGLLLAMVALRADALKQGQCGVCFTNGIACLDSNHFTPCFEGAPTDNKTPCPLNQICTNEPTICQSPETFGKPATCLNDYCGTCEYTENVFACLNETTYSFCFGQAQPMLSSMRNCPTGFVCNFDNFKIPENIKYCKPADTTKPSCIPTVDDGSQTTTTTQATEVEPSVFCSGLQMPGNFKHPTDTTCTKYIFCYLLSDQYIGQLVQCEKFYDKQAGKCVPTKPADC